MFAIDLNWRDTIFSRVITPRWSMTTDDDFALLFQEIKTLKKESKEICFIQFNAFFFLRRWQSPSQRLQKVKRWSLTFWEFRLRWYQAGKTYRLDWLDVWCDYWVQSQYIQFFFLNGSWWLLDQGQLRSTDNLWYKRIRLYITV